MAAYSKGNKMIAVEYPGVVNHCKNPGLYIGEGNKFLKVASFKNEACAEDFEKWLKFFFGKALVEDG